MDDNQKEQERRRTWDGTDGRERRRRPARISDGGRGGGVAAACELWACGEAEGKRASYLTSEEMCLYIAQA